MTVQESGENSGKKLQKQSLMFKVVLITTCQYDGSRIRREQRKEASKAKLNV
jgi:hypothetical protein